MAKHAPVSANVSSTAPAPSANAPTPSPAPQAAPDEALQRLNRDLTEQQKLIEGVQKNLETLTAIVQKLASGAPPAAQQSGAGSGSFGEIRMFLREIFGSEKTETGEIGTLMPTYQQLTRELLENAMRWQIKDLKKRLGIVEHFSVEG